MKLKKNELLYLNSILYDAECENTSEIDELVDRESFSDNQKSILKKVCGANFFKTKMKINLRMSRHKLIRSIVDKVDMELMAFGE